MKPLLRAVLILDAVLLLAFGLLFLLTPWTSLYNALQLVQTQPALVGQGFGVALIGLAWLAMHASIDGALTSSVAKVVGHVNWLTGVLMLVWLLGLHTPALTGFGQIVAVLTGVVLLLIGLGGVRLASAVRRRERERLAEAAAAERAERQAAKDAARNAANRQEPQPLTAGFPVYHPDTAVAPAVTPATSYPVVDEANLTAAERAKRAERSARASASSAASSAAAARDDARNAAADAPGGPRPPFHG
ncbi:hypothetical protein [Paraburkholderia sp. BCC1886]|uniref:hypothetical protein n=1 Tax=Paraburkholderia sp. BCC1886 TaxID=2562670 RepID=UPI001183A711|nr:hypothetical protein [Paraburkholderia sp. BCC1886]